MTFRRVEWTLWKIHRAGCPERAEKMLIELSHHRRWFSGGHCRGETVEDRSRSYGIIAGQPHGNLSGIGEETGSFVELLFRDELTALVDCLRVLLDGDTDDAG
jgi:hypothetical protein